MHVTLLRRRPAALLPATLALLLAASAGSALAGGDIATLESPGPDAAASAAPDGASKDPQQAMLDFAQCMRDHGIDMPDPQFTADGGGFTISGEASSEESDEGDDGGPSLSGPMSDPELQAADEACSSLLEGAMPQMDPEQQAEAQAEALAYSQCMRDHGVDMPDPQFGSGPGGGGMTIAIGGPGTDIDPRSPEFQAAQEACGGSFGFGVAGSAPEGGPDGLEPGASAAP